MVVVGALQLLGHSSTLTTWSSLFVVLIICVVDNVHGQMRAPMCPGPCVSPHQCAFHTGRVLGACGPNLVCCEYGGSSGSCGTVMRATTKVTNFKSPHYPEYSSGSLICKFDLELESSTAGVRIDFLDLHMDSTPVTANFEDPGTPACDSDMFFVKGFKDWSPDPRCGNLTGYSALVEMEPGQPVLTLVFVMSSFAYKWHVKMTTISHVELQQAGQILENKLYLSSPAQPMSSSSYQRPRFGLKSRLPSPPNDGQDQDEFGSSKNRPVPLIGGGEDAKPSSVPWQVSIQTIRQVPLKMCGDERNISLHFCGGSIIDDTTILTAAHCFLSAAKYPHPLMDLNLIKIVVGEHNLCHVDEVPHTKHFAIASVMFHFNYLSAEIINDVAIIKLAGRIQFNEGVQPIQLAYPGIQTMGMSPLLSGWGSFGTEQNATYPPILQQTTALQILSDQECMQSTLNYLKLNPHNRLSYKFRSAFARGVCTRGVDNGIEAGFGDSGGPLSVKDGGSNKYFLLGVVSHKRPEKDEKSGKTYNMNYFGKVPEYASWILMGLVPPL